jgi:hypothetical protein
MNAMGHGIANAVGVRHGELESRIRRELPGFMAMGEAGMQQHVEHGAHMPGPENTLPMTQGEGPFGPIGMGGMLSLVKVRPGLSGTVDPGWYGGDGVPRARRVAAPVPQQHEHTEHHHHEE